MSISPFDIEIENKHKYTLVAFLVDRDDFLNDIEDIRKKLKLPSIPYTFSKLPYERANNVTNYYHKNIASIYDVSECFKDIAREEHVFISDIDKVLATAVMYAESLSKKYNKTALYIPVILSAILTGVIKDADFAFTTRVLKINISETKRLCDELETDEEIITIQINRESTKEEVLKTFNTVKRLYFRMNRIADKNELAIVHLFNIPVDKLPDTIKNIDRDREWYWMYKNGLTHDQILEIAIKSKKQLSKDGIRKAIYQYRDGLNQSRLKRKKALLLLVL